MPRPPRLPDTESRRGLSPTDSIVIGNVERLYREHGLIAGNQSELGRRAELDQTFISKLLKGKTSISVSSLHGLAKALGLDPWMLLVPGNWPLSNPPVLQPLSDAEKQLYAKIREAAALSAEISKGVRP